MRCGVSHCLLVGGANLQLRSAFFETLGPPVERHRNAVTEIG